MKTKSIANFAAMGFALTLLITPGATADDWVMIGKRKVSDQVETDTIHLNGTRKFKKVKLCVYNNPVRFKDVDIYFANGGHQDVSLKSRINPHDCTRVIDLKGGDRDLDRIVMRYEETSRKHAKASVRVFAK